MKNLKFALIFLAICVICSLLIFYFNKSFAIKPKSEPVKAEIKTEDLYKSNLVFYSIFEKCGHTVSDFTSDTVSYSSAEELTTRYPGYEITSGEGENLVLCAKFNAYCPNHYFVILKDNTIDISRLDDGKIISLIQTDPATFSAQEKKLLETGITLDSQEALTSFIEDFTS